ncbi:MAG: DUF3881 family protein [Lachnospiraceae bacterium]|nr:DUF3881 family protein [Lachnospiraceae bacterium]
MHSYMSAVGFSKITNEELDKLLYSAIRSSELSETAVNSDNSNYVEIRMSVCKNMGIAIRGTYDDEDAFKIDYYFPYYIGSTVSTDCDFEIIKQSDRESYQGWADEPKLGVSLIFFLDNMMTYLNKYKDRSAFYGERYRKIYLSGLSLDGKVLLPAKEDIKNKDRIDNNRASLVSKAREGDVDAIENLTLEDIDTYAMISRRISKEDIYSIVKTSFMPFGIESDKYSVIGIIKDVKEYINQITMEEMYILQLSVNDMFMEVCINKKNLLGEPKVGRRFKGNIWLQGHIEF